MPGKAIVAEDQLTLELERELSRLENIKRDLELQLLQAKERLAAHLKQLESDAGKKVRTASWRLNRSSTTLSTSIDIRRLRRYVTQETIAMCSVTRRKKIPPLQRIYK